MKSSHENVSPRQNIPVRYIKDFARIAVLSAGVALPAAPAEATPSPSFNGGTMYVGQPEHLSKAEKAYEKAYIKKLNANVSYDLQDGIIEEDPNKISLKNGRPTFFDGALVRHDIQGHQYQTMITRPLVEQMPEKGITLPLDGSGIQLVGYIDRKTCTAHFRRMQANEELVQTSPDQTVDQYSFYFPQAKNGLRKFSLAYSPNLPNGEGTKNGEAVVLHNIDGSPITDIGEYVAEAAEPR